MLLHLISLQKHNRFNTLIWKLRFQLLKKPVNYSCRSECGNFNVSYINYNTKTIICTSKSTSVQTEIQELLKTVLTNANNLHSVPECDINITDDKSDISGRNTKTFRGNGLSKTKVQKFNLSPYSSIKHIRFQIIELLEDSSESGSSRNILETSSSICYPKESPVINKCSKQEFISHSSCSKRNVLHSTNIQSSELYMKIMEVVKNISKDENKDNFSNSAVEVESTTLANVSRKKDNVLHDYNYEQNCKKETIDPRLEVRVKIPELAINLPKYILKSESESEVVDAWFDDFLEGFKHKLNLSVSI